ncbi:MAG: DUF4810 domain-containing protein [Deltaproteobacteria bacterium]|nr:DUF4810 domain-containing protein [Deltaproteobacteria bacterium]
MKTCVGSLLLLLLVPVLLASCASQRMYYWGDYSTTLYHSRKVPCEGNLLKHTQALENIIQKSEEQNLRVPPGVYAELGYVYFRQNATDTAVKYFLLEEQTYPESRIFMERLVQAARARAADTAEEENAQEDAAKE